ITSVRQVEAWVDIELVVDDRIGQRLGTMPIGDVDHASVGLLQVRSEPVDLPPVRALGVVRKPAAVVPTFVTGIIFPWTALVSIIAVVFAHAVVVPGLVDERRRSIGWIGRVKEAFPKLDR